MSLAHSPVESFGPRLEAAVGSQAAANQVQAIYRVGRFEDASALFEELMADEWMMKQRAREDSTCGERLVISGLCAYLDAQSEPMLRRGEKILSRCLALFPEPKDQETDYAYACLFARLGKVKEALVWLERALAKGFSRDHARGDGDLANLRGAPDFKRLVG